MKEWGRSKMKISDFCHYQDIKAVMREWENKEPRGQISNHQSFKSLASSQANKVRISKVKIWLFKVLIDYLNEIKYIGISD